MAKMNKQQQQAYEMWRDGEPYADIAKKKKVSVATVKSWYQRYGWKSMREQEEQYAVSPEVCGEVASGRQASGAKVDIAKPTTVFTPIVRKQIEDTNPAKIYAEYSRDNLPEITDREARFVEEYIIDLDKKQAAIRAGYSVANADTLGCRLFSRPDVNAHIQVALAERMKRSGMNADIAIRELARIARANPANVIAKDGSILDSANEDDLAAVQSVKVKTTPTKSGEPIVEREIRFHDKTRAIELYMKAAGMLIDKKEVNVTTKIEEMTDDERRKEIKRLEKQLAIDADFTVLD